MQPPLPLHLLGECSDNATIRIGLPIDTAAHGVELIVGASLATARHRRLGGQPVSAVWCDDHRSTDGGRAAALHLANLGIRTIVGHFSSRAALAAAPVYAANDALFIAPGSSAPDLTATHRQTVLRLFGRDDTQAAAIADVLHEVAPLQTVEILTEDNAYGRGVAGLLAERLENNSIASDISVIRDDETTSSTGAGPVVLAGRHEFSARLLRRLSPTRVRIATDDALTPTFLHAADAAANGVLIPMIAPPAHSDEASEMNDGYARLCGQPPGGYFLTSYVAIDLILHALRNNGDGGGADIAARLRSRRWPTVLGELSIASSGDIDGLTWQMVRVMNEKFVRT